MRKHIKVADRLIGLEQPPFIIAEMSGNHNQSLDRALTHVVAFHSHQCIEKCFKAVFEEHAIEIPKIHNLITAHSTLKCNTWESRGTCC